MASLVSSLLTVSYHTAQAVALHKDAEMPDRSEWSFSQKVCTSEVALRELHSYNYKELSSSIFQSLSVRKASVTPVQISTLLNI